MSSARDVDAAVAEAKSLGARIVREPADLPNTGRSAVAADPQGAVFALRAHRAPLADEPEVPPEGSFCWDELLTRDPAAAAAFCAQLCGCAVDGRLPDLEARRSADRRRDGASRERAPALTSGDGDGFEKRRRTTEAIATSATRAALAAER